jgi:hypothetical protein
MLPRMSDKEYDLFFAFLRKSQKYLEFGVGGSTYVASQHVEQSIIAIDSSKEWLDRVRLECANFKLKPNLIYVDIGPTKDWGYPIDQSSRDNWPGYHESVWDLPESAEADLYMVDGRFRVACFAQAVIHCDSKALIGFHDFASREQYHCVREIAREIATTEDMSFFKPLTGSEEKANRILEEYRFNPA